MLNQEQLSAALRIHRVKRFQTHRMLEEMSVAEHSLRVLAIYTNLGGKEPIPAAFHDIEEVYTGDIPSPAKAHISGLEHFEKMRPDFVDPKEKRLCKLADKLDLVLHIGHQTNYNSELKEIYDRELGIIQEIALDLGKQSQVDKILELME